MSSLNRNEVARPGFRGAFDSQDVFGGGCSEGVGLSRTTDSDISSEDVTAYTYDATGQLLSVDYADQQTDDESYAYDDNGNRITANGDTYTTGDDNQTTSDGTYSYVYDGEGNLIAKYVDEDADGLLDAGDTDVTIYAWDYRDQLTEVEHFSTHANYAAGISDQIVTYTYDAFNRLIGRTLDVDASAGTGDMAQYLRIFVPRHL